MSVNDFLQIGIDQNVCNGFVKMALYFQQVKTELAQESDEI